MPAVLQLPDEGETIMAARTRLTFKVPAAATGGRYSVAEYALPPGFPGPPPHVHRTFEHTWYVLEGVVRVQVGAETRELSAGSSAFVPTGVPHSFGTTAEAGARLLAVDSPGGLEEYYRELAAAFPPGTPLDRAVVAEIQQRYDTHPPAPGVLGTSTQR